MNGALCRCMTYYRVQAAIKRAAVLLKADGARVRAREVRHEPQRPRRDDSSRARACSS